MSRAQYLMFELVAAVLMIVTVATLRWMAVSPMSITPDQERWGVAAAVIKQHGHNAMVHAIERMKHFAAERDQDGMRFWIEISRLIHELIKTDESSVQ